MEYAICYYLIGDDIHIGITRAETDLNDLANNGWRVLTSSFFEDRFHRVVLYAILERPATPKGANNDG